MKLSTKLIIGFGVILLLFTTVAIIKLSFSDKVNTHIQSVTYTGDVLRQSALLQKLTLNLETGFRGYLLTNNEEALEPYKESLSLINSAFHKQKLLVKDRPDDLAKLNRIEQILYRWIDSFAKPIIQQKTLAKNSEAARERYLFLINNKLMKLIGNETMDTLRREFAEFDRSQNVLRDKNKKMLQASIANTDKYTLLLTLFSLVAGCITAWIILKTFRKKVHNMMLQAENISKGKFNMVIPAEGRDELSSLSHALNAMNKKLDESFSELERSNNELEQFAYVASHDLREPLRTISSFAKLLSKKYQDKIDQEADDYIKMIVDGATRMDSLISDMLEYSRVGTHGKPFKPVNLNDAVDIAINNLTAAIDEANASVSHENLPVIQGDNTQMVQLFQNLIANAIKFRKPDTKPEITISCKADKDDYIISVTDNGIGIPEEERERIFMIFQRLHTREEYQGTGIGLAVCKKIAERHKGKIWCESTPGEGTTFQIKLPENINKENNGHNHKNKPRAASKSEHKML